MTRRLPRPGSKTERLAKKSLEFRRLILGESPLTVDDMRPVWKARAERRWVGQLRHLTGQIRQAYAEKGRPYPRKPWEHHA